MDKRFLQLRYGQVWEDADVLLKGLNINNDDICLSIASAGCNVLAMLAQNPKKVIALDVNPSQIAALELRIAAFKSLDYEEILNILGSKHNLDREKIFLKCKSAFPSETGRNFWEQNKKLLIKNGAVLCGKFDKFLFTFGKIIKNLIHSQDKVNFLFNSLVKEERELFYHQTWNNLGYKILLRIFSSKTFVGIFGRHPSFFKYTDKLDLHSLMLQRFYHAYINLCPHHNNYLQYIFFGEHKYALPYYLREKNIDLIRNNLDKLEYHMSSINDYLSSTKIKINKWNLSDIFEYVDAVTFNSWMKTISSNTANRGRIVYWNQLTPRVIDSKVHDFIFLSDLSRSLFIEDKATFYSDLIVAQKNE